MSSLLHRELFGPFREDIWRQLAAQIGASFVDGSFWKGDKVEASHAEWSTGFMMYDLGLMI